MDEDVFSTPNYRLSKLLLKQIGSWPEQSRSVRFSIKGLITFIDITLLIPELVRAKQVWGNVDDVMEILPSIVLLLASMVLLSSVGIKNNLVLEFIRNISHDWMSCSDEPSLVPILARYSANGRKLMILHLIMYGSAVIFLGLPLTPSVLNVIAPINASRPKKNMFYTEYGVDVEKHYGWILFHLCLVTYIVVTVIAATNSALCIWVEHCCALFEIAGFYLRKEVENHHQNLNVDKTIHFQNELVYLNLCLCIKHHHNAIRFAHMIESAYTTLMAFIMGLCMTLISVTGVILLIQMNNTDNVMRYAAMTSGLLYQLYQCTSFGQKLIDHSNRITEYAYECKWLAFSPKARKILMFIIARAQRPCHLTVTKMYIMNMEYFCGVVKTSLSYFTVLSSVRR